MKNWLMTLTALFLSVVLAQSNPDIARVQMQMALAGHLGGIVNAVAFSPNGQLLATGGIDGKVILWNVETGQQIRKLEGHTNGVGSVAFSHDGLMLATGGDDRTVKLWNVLSGQNIRTFLGHSSVVYSVAFRACLKSRQTRFSAATRGDKTWKSG